MQRRATALLAACSLALVACSGGDSTGDAVAPIQTIDPELFDLLAEDPVLVLNRERNDDLAAELIAECAAGLVDDERCATVAETVPPIQPPVTMSERSVLPEGFTTVTVEITEADGTVCDVCMWLADSTEERFRGLKGVTSLGRPEAMAFLYDRPTMGEFYMFETVTPLSIAWFAQPPDDGSGGVSGDGLGGDLVSVADMEPCTSADASACVTYPAGGPFVLAIEVFQGDLASIGITEGATARVIPGTEATDCPIS